MTSTICRPHCISCWLSSVSHISRSLAASCLVVCHQTMLHPIPAVKTLRLLQQGSQFLMLQVPANLLKVSSLEIRVEQHSLEGCH